MPKIAEIEHTPNPNAIKFVLKQPVATGFPKSFPDVRIAESDPLAKALFEVGQVTSVFIQDRFVTVTKEDEAVWSELLPRLAPPIRQAEAVGGENDEPVKREIMAPNCDPNDEFLEKVRKVLTIHILPALAADGGGLELVGRHEKQVMIRYLGACAACPGGMLGTLMAIEGILRAEVDPEILVITV